MLIHTDEPWSSGKNAKTFPVKPVFITGGTGHIGSRLIEALVRKGVPVQALIRPESRGKLPAGAVPVEGNALNSSSYRHLLTPDHTFVQLVGVTHPNPLKKNQFRDIDQASGVQAVDAARAAGVRQFVYLSVAQPLPIMKDYVNARAFVEDKIQASGLPTTIVRPFYVLGPGRRWPMLLYPLYWILENQSATRAAAQRLGFLNVKEMVACLVWAIENPASGTRVLEVPDIRTIGRGAGA